MPKKNRIPKPTDHNAPELMRIDGAKGYVPGNVVIICRAAAKLMEFCDEWSLTPQELRNCADAMERYPNATL